MLNKVYVSLAEVQVAPAGLTNPAALHPYGVKDGSFQPSNLLSAVCSVSSIYRTSSLQAVCPLGWLAIGWTATPIARH